MATIDRLHNEHSEILDVLAVFEEQLEALGAESHADLDVMKESLQYLVEYPDNLHRSGEDLIYRRVAERDTTAHDLIEQLRSEHCELCQRSEALLEDVEDIWDDVVIAKDQFEQQARQFIQLQRRHVDREEHELLSRAERVLTAADWREIEQRARHRGKSVPHLGTDQRLYTLESHMQQRTGMH